MSINGGTGTMNENLKYTLIERTDDNVLLIAACGTASWKFGPSQTAYEEAKAFAKMKNIDINIEHLTGSHRRRRA